MNQKWNLQDIRPSEPRRKKAAPANDKPVEKSPKVKSHPSRGKKINKKLWFIGGSILFAIALVFFLVGNLTFSADVTIEPKHRLSTINTTLDAYLDPSSEQLSYEIMTVKATAERQVTPTGQEEVEEKARGVIEISNSTNQSQRLIATTRFATEGGLVYRTDEAVVVPGSSDGNPGTVQVEVVADEIGDEYNLPAGTNLTVPGFAEGGYDDLFASVRARIVEDFSGGFAGLRYEVDSAELEQAQQTMRSELREALRAKLESDKPAGFVLFENAITYSYETIPPVADAEEDKDTVQIVESATLAVPLFSESEFSKYIARAVVPGYGDQPVRIDNWQELTFAYENNEENNLLTSENINFSLRGDAKIVWTIPTEDFKTQLAGEQKAALRFIIPEYPAIEKASAKIRPVWKRSYPGNLEKITIKEKIDW